MGDRQVVVGVAVIRDSKVLAALRGGAEGGWEFPGGKVEEGERPEQTVIREMQEELGITIEEACLAPFVFASHNYPEFHLLMPLYLCRRWEGIAQPREGQKVAWVRPKDLALDSARYPMPPADAPLIPMLRDLL